MATRSIQKFDDDRRPENRNEGITVTTDHTILNNFVSSLANLSEKVDVNSTQINFNILVTTVMRAMEVRTFSE